MWNKLAVRGVTFLPAGFLTLYHPFHLGYTSHSCKHCKIVQWRSLSCVSALKTVVLLWRAFCSVCWLYKIQYTSYYFFQDNICVFSFKWMERKLSKCIGTDSDVVCTMKPDDSFNGICIFKLFLLFWFCLNNLAKYWRERLFCSSSSTLFLHK